MLKGGLFLYFGLGLGLLVGQVPISNPPGSLKSVPAPEPQNLNKFVKANSKGAITPQARAAAIALGKALFWDMSVGSDGMSCATCHYSAGADTRTKNQLDPGLRAVPPDTLFSSEAPYKFGANQQLQINDFPLFRSLNVFTNDVVSSQGVFNSTFIDITPGQAKDVCTEVSNLFWANGKARNVEPRNTPTMINAVYNYRNFWDGRARNEFNGVNPIGDLDPFAFVLHVSGSKNKQLVEHKQLIGDYRLERASLASQSVGPPLSEMEMSCLGRTFPKLGKKMLSLQPLMNQQVAQDDSILGSYTTGKGLTTTYGDLIKAAFENEWWDSNVIVDASGNPTSGAGFSMMEYNFSLFWGLAVQMYEATLIANDSPFDKYFDGNANALTDQQKLGLDVFLHKGQCINCHGGPELTNASVRTVKDEKLERMLMGNNQVAVYDEGFYNTAVTRCGPVPCDDLGLGATIGPLNLPLSVGAFYQLVLHGDANALTACQSSHTCDPPPVGGLPPTTLNKDERIAVIGAFKTPGLRNIELQAPYFHNGGEKDLLGVVNFYNQGGNFVDLNRANVDPDIERLGLTGDEKAALVALMIGMTDERVRYQRAPFDHPELQVENLGTLPAVGRNGSALPLRTFLDNLKSPPATP